MENAAAAFLLSQNGIADAYTRTQFESGAVQGTHIATLMRRAWNREASGDLMVITKPFWYFGTGNSGTSHGSPYAYDTNVPLMIMGKRWIAPGYYPQYAEVVDLDIEVSDKLSEEDATEVTVTGGAGGSGGAGGWPGMGGCCAACSCC